MSYHEIIKAWKDPEYRAGLSNKKRALLPENPAGLIELTDDDLHVAGADASTSGGCTTQPCIDVSCAGSRPCCIVP